MVRSQVLSRFYLQLGLDSIGCSSLNWYHYVHNKCPGADQGKITKAKQPALCLDLTYRFPYTPPREEAL